MDSSTPNHPPIGKPVTPMPAPWEPELTLGDDDRDALEALLGIPPLEAGQQYKWDKLVNHETGVVAYIRVHQPQDGQAVISAVQFISPESGRSVSQQDMRGLPIAAIADAYVREDEDSEYALGAAFTAGDFDRSSPLGRPDGTDQFYARVAQQFRHLEDASTQAPAKALAAVNGIGHSTAQRWITEARNRRFLPPGKTGRRVVRGGRRGD